MEYHSAEGLNTRATYNGTRTRRTIYGADTGVPILWKPSRLTYSVSVTPSKFSRLYYASIDDCAYNGTNAKDIEVCLRLLFNVFRLPACFRKLI